MKIIFFTLIFLWVGIAPVDAQRLLPGQKGMELGVGLISDKKPVRDYFYVYAGMTINGRNGNYKIWAFEYSRKKHEFEKIAIPVETYTVEGGYSFCLLGDWQKNISLNTGLTAIGGYETVNRSKSLLANGAVIRSSDHFIYGAGIRISLETYLGNHLVMVLQGRTKFILATSVERFRPSAGVGLRYIF